jgi:hypothetical protein
MDASRNPYAPSTASLSGTDVHAASSRMWRDAKVLVMALDAGDLPGRCVKCNEAADEPSRTRKLYWHHPGIYLTLVISPIVYLIVALIARKTVKLSPGLCAQHKQKRSLGLAIGWGGFLLCFGGMVVAFNSESPGLGLLLLLAMLGCIITGMILSRIVYARRIDDRYVQLNGCGEPFLAELPEFRPGARDY